MCWMYKVGSTRVFNILKWMALKWISLQINVISCYLIIYGVLYVRFSNFILLYSFHSSDIRFGTSLEINTSYLRTKATSDSQLYIPKTPTHYNCLLNYNSDECQDGQVFSKIPRKTRSDFERKISIYPKADGGAGDSATAFGWSCHVGYYLL